VSTISPNSYGISTRDAEFRRALAEADYLLLDGVYFSLGSILLKGRSIKPNQGPDVFFFFMRKLNAIKFDALPLDPALTGIAARVTVNRAGARLKLQLELNRAELSPALDALLGP